MWEKEEGEEEEKEKKEKEERRGERGEEIFVKLTVWGSTPLQLTTLKC